MPRKKASHEVAMKPEGAADGVFVVVSAPEEKAYLKQGWSRVTPTSTDLPLIDGQTLPKGLDVAPPVEAEEVVETTPLPGDLYGLIFSDTEDDDD